MDIFNDVNSSYPRTWYVLPSYLYLLQYLYSVSYNFMSTGLLHPCLGVFLGIQFLFEAIVNGVILEWIYLIS